MDAQVLVAIVVVILFYGLPLALCALGIIALLRYLRSSGRAK